MMTANRRFEIWTSENKKFPNYSDEAWKVKQKLVEHFNISISTSTLYRMKIGKIKNITKGHSALQVYIKCTR